MSQCLQQIHHHFVIDDELTGLHSSRQNAAELIAIKYFKSHAQVLLDRTGTPDTMWFLAQEYLAHDPVTIFPENTERPGFFVGFSDNKGNIY